LPEERPAGPGFRRLPNSIPIGGDRQTECRARRDRLRPPTS
jgi:hypothetical protein